MENENQSQFDNFENQLSQAAIGYLKESAKWCKFLAIVGFVGVGLIVLIGLLMVIGIGAFSAFDNNPNMPFSTTLIVFIYLIFAAIYFFPIYYLYLYATKTAKALHTKNQQMLTEGLENLKSHHKFLGIFTLIIISLYGLIFVFAIIGGLLS